MTSSSLKYSKDNTDKRLDYNSLRQLKEEAYKNLKKRVLKDDAIGINAIKHLQIFLKIM